MSIHKDGSAGCLVYASGFHTYYTVFADVSYAYAVFSADLVEFCKKFHGADFLAVEFGADTLFKAQCNIGGFVGSLFR